MKLLHSDYYYYYYFGCGCLMACCCRTWVEGGGEGRGGGGWEGWEVEEEWGGLKLLQKKSNLGGLGRAMD